MNIGQHLKLEGETAKTNQIKEAKDREDVKASAKTVAKLTGKDTESYTVKSGESLNVIASRVGLSVQELADLNDLKSRAGLQRGQTIRIPKTVSDYKVKSGDSLIRIASKYGIETSALAEMNDLKPTASLRIGSVIKVPNL